ncbi:uncharacterized protein LOC132743759 [Ruditapes philippinarum]|uniref:uncharacterized protein LOC132743759 n=1 Tax=Ruditapes philippinarum TaxID=129788 RepID=UPI00295BC96F|nr:uncharacterized protein LOC132743759 [Ruditapes philippinarum]
MFMLILHITCLVGVATCAKYPYDEQMQTTVEDMEDNRFLVIKFIDGLFLYAEESVSYLDKNLVTIILHLDTCIQFIIDSISTIVDILIRQPATLVNYILYAISWTIDFLVYLLLDMAYHYLIKGIFLCVKWIVIYLLTFVTNFIFYSLLTVVYLSKSIVLSYFFIFTSIFVYFVTPLFQSVFWVLSFLAVSFCTVWVVFEMFEKFKDARGGGDTDILFFILLLLPFAYVLYSMWFILCSFIFNFICYPLMLLLYSCIVGLFTFFISGQIYEKCQQYATAFDKDKMFKALDTGFVQPLFRALGANAASALRERFSQSDEVDISENVDLECIVCFEETLLVKLFPCKHKIMCYNCLIRILESDYRCPVCRETIRYYQSSDH